MGGRDLRPRYCLGKQVTVLPRVAGVGALLRGELHRLQAVRHRQRTVRGQCRRQITQCHKPGKPGSVVGRVVNAPGWIHGVQVCAGDEWGNQRMTSVDARVQQAHVWRGVVFCRQGQAGEGFFHPLLLFGRRHAVEEVGCFLGAAQLCHAIKRHDRGRELLFRAEHQYDGALGKTDVVLADLALSQRRQLSEVREHRLAIAAHGQPDLPPDGFSRVQRQQGWIVGPQRADLGATDCRDRVQQRMVIERMALDVLALDKIVLDILLEVRQLAVWNEDIGIGRVAVDPHAQYLNLLLRVFAKFVAQALEGQRRVGLPDKLNLQAEPAFQPLILLGGDGLLSQGPQREQLGLEDIAVLGAVEHRNSARPPARRRRRERLRG